MKILNVQSSPNPVSVTRALSEELIKNIKNTNSDAVVLERDINKNPIPHLSGLSIHAAYTPVEARDENMNNALKLSDELIKEIFESDVIVIGAPMWNFSVPSVLKAWIDQIIRVGVTFQYTEQGPQGLIKGEKTVIIVSSRGGVYSSGPYAAFDHQETLLKGLFMFLGIEKIEAITSEGLRGQDVRTEAVQNAQSKISEIIAKL
jgi:FMN-dependent NADH-azoreductase